MMSAKTRENSKVNKKRKKNVAKLNTVAQSFTLNRVGFHYLTFSSKEKDFYKGHRSEQKVYFHLRHIKEHSFLQLFHSLTSKVPFLS
jgi:hypothetical protein